MNEDSLSSSLLIQAAISRAYANMDSSTRALLGLTQILIASHTTHWYIAVLAPNPAVWKRIVKRLESITRRLEETMSSFILAVCTTDDPVPPSGAGVGRVQRQFLIDQRWFVQLGYKDHTYWVEVAPENLLSPAPPQAGEDDRENDDDIPF